MTVYLYIIFTAILILIVGTILISILNKTEKDRDIERLVLIDTKLIPRIREAAISAMEEELDRIPDKLKEIHNKIGEEL